jgi:DNA-binding transcriptional LysR family regulator
MDMRYLNEFCTIVKHKNFSSAAKELNTSESVLSKHLLSIEKELGASLISRSPGWSTFKSLTPAGFEFLETALAIGNIYEKSVVKIRKLSYAPPLDVKYCCSVAAALTLFLTEIQSLKHLGGTPVHISNSPIQNKDPFQMLRDEIIDFCFEPHSEAANTCGLEKTSLFSIPASFIVTNKEEYSSLSRISIEDLADYDFLTPSSQNYYSIRRHLFSYGERHGLHLGQRLIPEESITHLLIKGSGQFCIMLPSDSIAAIPQNLTDKYAILRASDLDSDYSIHVYYRLAERSEITQKVLSVFEEISKRIYD